MVSKKAISDVTIAIILVLVLIFIGFMIFQGIAGNFNSALGK